MLSEALRVPARAADATGTLVVGVVLTGVTVIAAVGWVALLAVAFRLGVAATPIVFLLGLVVRGYFVRVVAAGVNDRSVAPSFVRWGSLLRAGVRSTLVSVIYVLPAAVCLGLAGGAGVATVIDPPGFSGALQVLAAVAILIGGFGLLCYLLVYLYLRPAARAVLAATGSVRAAINPRRSLRVSLSGPYLSGWLIAMGLLTVGPLLVTPLVILAGLAGLYDPALGAIGGLLTVGVTVILVFWLRMSTAWVIGRGAAPALAAGTAALVAPDGPPRSSEKTAVTVPDRPAEVSAAVQVGRAVNAVSDTHQANGGTDRSTDTGVLDSPAEPTTQPLAESTTGVKIESANAESPVEPPIETESDDDDNDDDTPLWDAVEE